MAIVNTRLVFDAVYTMLDTGISAAPLHDNESPPDVTTLPYVIVRSAPGGDNDGPLGAPDDDLEVPIQVDCVSRERRQCQWLQHSVRLLMLSQALTVGSGIAVKRIYLDDPSGVYEDNTLGEGEGKVFYTTDVFHVMTTPE